MFARFVITAVLLTGALSSASLALAQEPAADPIGLPSAPPSDEPKAVREELQRLLQTLENEPGDGTAANQPKLSDEDQALNDRLLSLVERMDKLESEEAKLRQSGSGLDPVSLQGERDPFAITERLKRVTSGGIEGVQFVPSAGAPTAGQVPKMRLRGIMRSDLAAQGSSEDGESEPGPVAALLEIDGAGVYVVRIGDTVGLQELGSSSVIKILRVDQLSLVVEVGTLGQVIVVR